MTSLACGTPVLSAQARPMGVGPIANTNPDHITEIQNNTVCSFINVNKVNIRKGPGSQYATVTQLNRGDGVRAVSRQGNWVQIAARVYGFGNDERIEPFEGWVSNQYINGCSEDQFDRWRK
ncbi:SH3 domain-containing protein [Kamptonema formosum]|uniref:SH3 domain-containing protein n=1 Tax=Kamptonema formosum TaxID=331992 RepID=UPI001E319B64|nr:SH3 domain-containing protein [Oscillatoria sp. PCC 10802]